MVYGDWINGKYSKRIQSSLNAHGPHGSWDQCPVPPGFRGGSGVPVLIVRAVGEDIAQHP